VDTMTAIQTPSSWKLERVIALAQQTLDSLRTEHGQIIEDDATAIDSLLAEGVDIPALMRSMVRASQEAKANADAVGLRIDELKTRVARYDRQQEKWRETILAAMQALDMTKHSDPEFSLSIRDGNAKLHIADIDALPRKMVVIIKIKKPLTADIRAALESGKTVAGATLGNAAPILTIRSR